MTDADFQELLNRCMEELRLKTTGHAQGWGLGSTDRWDLDQQTGQLVFTSPANVASAPAQIIGTYSTANGTWLWAWDHPSVLLPRHESRSGLPA